MPLADYAHHNEEAHAIWWAEEGRHDTRQADFERYYLNDEDIDLEDDESECTCTYGSDPRSPVVGTNWGIIEHDDNCPEHS